MESLKTYAKQEEGLTLVEVLASIVILTLVLFAFSSIYTHSWKATAHSKNIIDTTYIAQKEMEKLYRLSKDRTYEETIMILTNSRDFIEVEEGVFENTTTYEGAKVKLSFYDVEDSFLKKAIVSIYKENEVEADVLMENRLKWKAG